MSRKYRNSVVIDKDSVIKKKNDEVLELYDYLLTCNFDNFPKVIDVNDDEVRSEYIESKPFHEKVSGSELIKTMALLHSKTVFYKDVSPNKYKEVYDKILGNIEYLKEYYEQVIEDIESEIYMSPSHYLFARNYSVILGSLKYAFDGINSWYNIVKDKHEQRVCIVHNNVRSDHFIKGDKNYLISFEKHLVDTPILDLYKYYKNEGYKLSFKMLFEEYKSVFSLLPEEEKLFNVLISIPPKLEFNESEIENTILVKDTLKYVYDSYRIVS